MSNSKMPSLQELQNPLEGLSDWQLYSLKRFLSTPHLVDNRAKKQLIDAGLLTTQKDGSQMVTVKGQLVYQKLIQLRREYRAASNKRTDTGE